MELARAGDLDAVFALGDRLAYKWMCAAADFGNDDADDRIGDVLEVTAMRYDDSGFERAAAHWELATAYLEGSDGLARDLSLAERHLEAAFEHHDLVAINAGTNESYSANDLLARLDDQAKSLLEMFLAGPHYFRVINYTRRLHRLRSVNAPTVIVDNEKRLLREAVDALLAQPD